MVRILLAFTTSFPRFLTGTLTRTQKRRIALSECSSALPRHMRCFPIQKGVPNMTVTGNFEVAAINISRRGPIVGGQPPLNLPQALAISVHPSTYSTSSSATPLVLVIQCTLHCLPLSISRLIIRADDVRNAFISHLALKLPFSDRRRHTTSLFGGHPFVDKDENNW